MTTPNPLLDPSRWCKGTLSERRPGELVRGCFQYWINHTLRDVDKPTRAALKWEIIRHLPEWACGSPVLFWDHPDTTHEMALEVLKRAGWIKDEAKVSVS